MGGDSRTSPLEDAMNRTRRTALTATIAAGIIGGATAVVAGTASPPAATGDVSSAASTPTSSASATPIATSSTDPTEAALRNSIRSLEDEIAALELFATLASVGPASLPTATPSRTAGGFDRHGAGSGPGRNGVEDDGVHQHRGRGSDHHGGDDDHDDDSRGRGGDDDRDDDDDSRHGGDDRYDDSSGHGGNDDDRDDDD
jgi:hypothetical protein